MLLCNMQAQISILTPTQIEVNYIFTKCGKSGHTVHEQRLLSKDLSFLCTKWSNVRQQLLFGTNPHCNYRHENWLLTFIRITILVIRDSSQQTLSWMKDRTLSYGRSHRKYTLVFLVPLLLAKGGKTLDSSKG